MLEVFSYLTLNVVYKCFRIFGAVLKKDFKLVKRQEVWKPEFILIALKANYFLKK